jgi:imidazolonepropionase-like amidohydrolase
MRDRRDLLFPFTLAFLLWMLFACAVSRAQDLALVGTKIYPSPAGVAVEGGIVLVHGGRIAAAGPSATIKIPKDATVLNCQGMVVTAGFWNSHVHILTSGLLQGNPFTPELIRRLKTAHLPSFPH